MATEWVSVSELARRLGVDKGPVSRRVARFEAQGLIETKAGERGAKLVDLESFEKAVEETEDAVRAANGAGRSDPVLAKEQARKAALQADMAQLDLDERLGRIVTTESVQHAMADCAEALVRVIEQLPGQAEELAGAVAREGVEGARAFLKEIARQWRERLAREMRLIANGESNPE